MRICRGLQMGRGEGVPLRLRLSNGRSFEIRSTGLCFIANLADNAFRAKRHDALAEDVEVFSLRHIVSVGTTVPLEHG